MANSYRTFSEMLPLRTEAERAWCKEQLEYLHDSEEDHRAEFEWAFEEDGLWIYATEYGNVDDVVAFVQDFLAEFRPDGCFSLAWAETCSKPRIGEFGGGAVFVTKNTMEYQNTGDWLQEKRLEHEHILKRIFQR